MRESRKLHAWLSQRKCESVYERVERLPESSFVIVLVFVDALSYRPTHGPRVSDPSEDAGVRGKPSLRFPRPTEFPRFSTEHSLANTRTRASGVTRISFREGSDRGSGGKVPVGEGGVLDPPSPLAYATGTGPKEWGRGHGEKNSRTISDDAPKRNVLLSQTNLSFGTQRD